MSDKITRNIPASLKDFHKVLSSFEFKHDLNQVFNDFMDLHLQAWSREPLPELNERCQRVYSQEERHKLGQLIWLHTKALEDGICANGWFDALGTYYEAFAGNWKKGRLGQFFTPAAICDIMPRTVMPEGDFNLIGEPTCGSGRIILANQAVRQKNFYYAQDIDPMCVRMCALNMLHHGAQGVVLCMDTLKNSDFRFGYAVNVGLHYGNVPNVIYTNERKEVNHYWQLFQQIAASRQINSVEEPQESYLAAYIIA